MIQAINEMDFLLIWNCKHVANAILVIYGSVQRGWVQVPGYPHIAGID